MKSELVEVVIREVVPTPGGFAVFLGNHEKTFVIYVDHDVGAAILMFYKSIAKPRPLTHDLIGSILTGLEARVHKVVINDLKANTFYARLILSEESSGRKRIVEIDARPSDCVAVALQQDVPILVARGVLEKVKDVSEMLGGEEP
ncbi:MAG: bifunctional nuclease family protein [Candidatus Tritonobacter lacicola]|nr:bifunctional nuclease family protein [Candidatus Tritonobacter lacicola]